MPSKPIDRLDLWMYTHGIESLKGSKGYISMAVAMKTTLRNLREDFQSTGKKVSQESMARRSNISLQAYRNVENGGNTTYTTAKNILAAINSLLVTSGKPEINLDHLNLSIV